MKTRISDYEISAIVVGVVNSDYIGFFHSESWRRVQAAASDNSEALWQRFNRVYDGTLDAIDSDAEAAAELKWEVTVGSAFTLG